MDERILRVCRQMYDVFFEERHLIPSRQFHEVSFEKLEKDPVGQVQKIYEALNLPDFSQVVALLRQYVAGQVGYQKNRFPGLSTELRKRIGREWRRLFEEWGYTM